jgi:hypothetical protein
LAAARSAILMTNMFVLDLHSDLARDSNFIAPCFPFLLVHTPPRCGGTLTVFSAMAEHAAAAAPPVRSYWDSAVQRLQQPPQQNRPAGVGQAARGGKKGVSPAGVADAQGAAVLLFCIEELEKQPWPCAAVAKEVRRCFPWRVIAAIAFLTSGLCSGAPPLFAFLNLLELVS